MSDLGTIVCRKCEGRREASGPGALSTQRSYRASFQAGSVFMCVRAFLGGEAVLA